MIRHMSKAEQLFSYKARQGALIVEMQIYRLPRPDNHRPHGLHFRLYFGRADECLVLYDTHTGKAAHRHLENVEEPYEFTTVDALLDEFQQECARRGWDWGK